MWHWMLKEEEEGAAQGGGGGGGGGGQWHVSSTHPGGFVID